MTTIDIDRLYDLDPRPFYRAVLGGTDDVYDLLDEHPIDDRPILVWNAAIKSIKHYFNYRSPGRKPRESFLSCFAGDVACFQAKMGADPLPIISRYIEAAFQPESGIKRLVKVNMDLLCETGLFIPSVVNREYPWKNAGEREALIMTMYFFDHTYRRNRGADTVYPQPK